MSGSRVASAYFHDRERALPGRRFDADLVARAVAQERLTDRRSLGDAPLPRVCLEVVDDDVLFLLAFRVPDDDVGAEPHLGVRLAVFGDDFYLRQRAFELSDPL